MTKHTAMVFLGILVMVIPITGLPSWVQTSLLVLSGFGISVLAYLSAVAYCNNCKKLIENADQIFDLASSNEDKKINSQQT